MAGGRAARVMAVTMSAAMALAACRAAGGVEADGAAASSPTSATTAGPTPTTTTTAATGTTAATTTAATPTTAATSTTSTVATAATAGAGPDQAQPRTAEEAQRVLDAYPASEEPPPFDVLLTDDLDVGLRGIIADPARTSDFFAEVASGRPVGVIATPFLICDPDRGGEPCTASVERYRAYMEGCVRPGTVAVRRLVTTEPGWAAVGVCALEVGAEHLARAVDLVRASLVMDGRPISDDPDLQQLTDEWVTYQAEQETLDGAPAEEAGDLEFLARFRALTGDERGRCWRIRLDKDPLVRDRLDAQSPLGEVAGDSLRLGIAAGPGSGHIRVRLCAVPA